MARAESAPTTRTDARPRTPRGEGGRLRDQLVAATAELLEETGDAARVSVRAIAGRAGVSPTALYLHFPDRDAVVAAAVEAGFVAFDAALRAAAEAHDDPVERLAAMGLAYLEFTRRQPALYATIFSARRPALATTGAGVHGDRAFEGLVSALRACEPRAPEDELTERAVALWSTLHGYALLSVGKGDRGPGGRPWPSPERFVRQTLSVATPR